MSSLEMQRVLARVLTDISFREAFWTDSESACAHYSLRPEEFQALALLPIDRIDTFAGMLGNKRLDLALRAFPITRFLLTSDFAHDYCQRYCQENPSVPVAASPMLCEAKSLASFIRRLIGDGELTNRYLREVLDYEYAIFVLGHDPEVSASAEGFARRKRNRDSCGNAVISDADRPMTGIHVQAAESDYDLGPLISQLRNRVIPDCAAAKTWLLFVKQPHRVDVSLSKINCHTYRLIGLADGNRTIQEICNEMSTYGLTSDIDLHSRCKSMIARLINLNVLVV